MSITVFRGVQREMLAAEFEELFLGHYQLVYRTAYSVTGCRQDAEDVLQTLFLKLLQLDRPVDLTRNPKAYLYRASVNLSLNIVRARNSRNVTDDVESIVSPAESDAATERRQRLVQAMAQLHPRAVEILVLRYEHDYSDAEIAKVLGTTRGVIAVTLFRARARLKKLLAFPGDNA